MTRSDYGWPGLHQVFYSIEISGDTIINSIQYHKLFTPYIQTSVKSKSIQINTGYNGAIRQDTLIRKVFIVPRFESTEQLLYDFTMQVGDSVKGFIQTVFDPKDVVFSIDSVLVGNSYRKRWNINLSYNISIIEGVGCTFGLIEQSPGQIIDYYDIGISCFRQNDLTIYPDTLTNCELITSVNPIEKQIDLINVYPNPSNGTFNIEFDQSKNIKQVQVTDLIGNIIFQKEKNIPSKLCIDNLSPGIFMLSIIDQDNKRINKKILNYP
jgi:hypothetical protein